MNPKRHPIILLPLVLLLSSCFPEERIWWSPKGDRALVSISGALHLVHADGEPGAPLANGVSLEHALVKTVSWLPDGSGFVCERERVCTTWEEVRALISEEESAAVEQMAPAVLPLLQAAALLAEKAKTLDEVAAQLPVAQKKRFSAAVLRRYLEDPDTVEKLLLPLPDGKQIVEALRRTDMGFHVSELCLYKLDGGNEPRLQTWNRSLLRQSLMPKVSPRHGLVACLQLDEKEETATLEVLPLGGGPALVVASNVSPAFDWMPDGRTLVFMAPIGGEGEKLQSIHRITVVQENGTLMKPRQESQGPDALEDPVTVATTIMLNRPVLQVLSDGRVLFASQPVVLPIGGPGPELEPRLYLVSSDGKSVQAVPTTSGDLPTNLGYFTASPDGRLVAVVESETDAVAVVELSTGKTQIISPPHARWQCETIPAWKSATELTFAALHGAAGEPKWMLWTEGAGVRCISEKWPATATADWLEHKKPEAGQDASAVNAKPSPTR